MHGRKLLAILLLAVVLAGCADAVPEPNQQLATTQTPLGEAFDESLTGTLRGAVLWQGDQPQLSPLKVLGLPGDYPVNVRQDQPNPNAPVISASGAIDGAIVFLRHVDLRKSKPWDHPRVRVEHRDRRLVIQQGETASHVAFVRAGDAVAVVNLDNHYHMLRGRGADFFSLPLPRPNVASQRRMLKPGIVELSSGAFFFWMRGYLIVDTHPYYARTDATGQFVLENVPAGAYELVCWMPSWQVATRQRDPDTGHVIQIDFEAPLEQTQAVNITPGRTSQADFSVSIHARR